MTVFVLQWLLHELHHLFAVAGFRSHCHFVGARDIPPGRYGYHYYAGKMVCKLYGTYGRMNPKAPPG